MQMWPSLSLCSLILLLSFLAAQQQSHAADGTAATTRITRAASSFSFTNKLHYVIDEEEEKGDDESHQRKVQEEPPNTPPAEGDNNGGEGSEGSEEGENEDEPPAIPPYKLWTPQDIRDRLFQLADHYPTLMRLTTAQEEYGLPTAGTAEDCPYDKDVDGCFNYIVTLQDFVTHPEGSESSNRLPEVLLSGELHGNEQVGPTAVMETLVLLLKAASCIAYPRLNVKQSVPSEWTAELERAKSCRQELSTEDGIAAESHMRWLARLVSTRRVVIVPTANALGYFRTMREENGIDPNRDFPYDTEPSNCMRTIAGRTLNEVFRQHMFQLSLTFHGGMEVIGYEWGAPSFNISTSPDDTAESQIAAAYSRFGGGFSGSRPYDYGPMNDYVYPVNGGMEDWAYGASWDTERVVQCTPDTFGGYPAEKTTYDNSTLRVFNMLVECSNSKIPRASTLGSAVDLMNRNGAGNGHISRNLRLSLLAIELVQPWLSIRQVNDLLLTEDIVPLQEPAQDASQRRERCQTMKRVRVPANSRKVVIEWQVGGSLQVDRTNVWYAKWSDVSEQMLVDCINQPALNVVEGMLQGTAITDTSGVTQFSSKGTTKNGIFAASIDVSMFQPTDVIVVLAMARVDQAWANSKDPHVPDVPPQSHIVNARTNPDWHHEKPDGKVIQGRLDWFSQPLTIEMGEAMSADDVETIELSTRWNDDADSGPDNSGETPPAISPSSKPHKPRTSGGDKSSFGRFVVSVVFLGLVLGLAFMARQVYLRHLMRKAQRSRLREFIENESAISPGLQHVNGDNDLAADAHFSDHPDDDDDDVNGAENGGHVEMGRYSDRPNKKKSAKSPQLPRTMT